MMGESMYSDSDYRRVLGTKRGREEIDVNGPVGSIFPSSAAQEEGYYYQQQQLAMHPSLTASSSSSSWGSLAVSALGGMVGRIWQFCTVGPFKGFHAGGGRGYEMGPSIDAASMFQDDFTEQQNLQRRVPGYFPPSADELADPCAGDSRSSSPAAPPAKRRQMATLANDLNKDWIFIGKNGEASSAQKRNLATRQTVASMAPPAPSPRNRNSRPSVVTGRRISTPNVPRSQAGRPSLASTPTLTASSVPVATASSASYASPRSPSPSKIPIYSPSTTISTPKLGTSRRRSTAAPATLSHRRTNSAASMASSRASTMATSRRQSQSSVSTDKHYSQHEHVDSSPRLTAEAKKLAARRRREEDDADERMSMMGNQLRDMIRQAKEALGTTIEVDGDEGGWEDEEY